MSVSFYETALLKDFINRKFALLPDDEVMHIHLPIGQRWLCKVYCTEHLIKFVDNVK